MTVLYRLTPRLRRLLKKPIGTLIRGSSEQTVDKFASYVHAEKPTCLISVGDAVSHSLIKKHITPHLTIIDRKCMRKGFEEILPFEAERTINVANPRSTITEEAISAVREALLNCESTVKIVVDGEEDLLALTAIYYAPKDAVVVYGQPHEGIVVVKVTQAKKQKVSEILKTMTVVEKLKSHG